MNAQKRTRLPMELTSAVGDYKFYSAFGRRVSWFREIPYTSGFSVTNTEKFELIPSGTMYKQSEDRIDYLIIDEAQDFNVSDYQSRMIAHRRKKPFLVWGFCTTNELQW